MTADWLSDDDGLVPLAIVGEADEISYRKEGKCDTGLAGRGGLYSRMVSIGILGDFTKSGGKLAREPARLCGNGLTDGSLAPPFGQKNAPARCASLRCKPSAAAG